MTTGYRNNLNIWNKVTLRPRHLNDVSKLNETLPYVFLPLFLLRTPPATANLGLTGTRPPA